MTTVKKTRYVIEMSGLKAVIEDDGKDGVLEVNDNKFVLSNNLKDLEHSRDFLNEIIRIKRKISAFNKKHKAKGQQKTPDQKGQGSGRDSVV